MTTIQQESHISNRNHTDLQEIIPFPQTNNIKNQAETKTIQQKSRTSNRNHTIQTAIINFKQKSEQSRRNHTHLSENTPFHSKS